MKKNNNKNKIKPKGFKETQQFLMTYAFKINLKSQILPIHPDTQEKMNKIKLSNSFTFLNPLAPISKHVSFSLSLH